MGDRKVSLGTAELFVATAGVGGLLMMWGYKQYQEDSALLQRQKTESVPPAEQITGVSWMAYISLILGLALLIFAFWGTYYWSKA